MEQMPISQELDAACPLCDGQGMRIVQDASGRRSAVPCTCRVQQRARRILSRARIPRRYEHCTLESYEHSFSGAHPSLRRAYKTAQKFVENYPLLDTEGAGLLLVGSAGLGKTHLAVALLQGLILERGATGLFYEYGDLLRTVQNTYSSGVAASELEVLRPIFETEVLVLDELGGLRPSEWAWDTVAYLLNTRYNDKRTTIITTNYPNRPPLGVQSGQMSDARKAVRQETLGDRITERLRSRLAEMCIEVEMTGEDFRQLKPARLG